jgi:hypothetical protein
VRGKRETSSALALLFKNTPLTSGTNDSLRGAHVGPPAKNILLGCKAIPHCGTALYRMAVFQIILMIAVHAAFDIPTNSANERSAFRTHHVCVITDQAKSGVPGPRYYPSKGP